MGIIVVRGSGILVEDMRGIGMMWGRGMGIVTKVIISIHMDIHMDIMIIITKRDNELLLLPEVIGTVLIPFTTTTIAFLGQTVDLSFRKTSTPITPCHSLTTWRTLDPSLLNYPPWITAR
jgi:hypothetical protein